MKQIDEWGRVIFDAEDAVDLLLRGRDLNEFLVGPGPETDAYNEACFQHDQVRFMIPEIEVLKRSPQQDTEKRQNTWWMPEQYQTLDVREKLLNMCEDRIEIERVNMEMDMFEVRDLLPVLRLMCFLVDRWRQNNVVWGVGRGSSVSSYCLFLIGVHKIDSIKYDLDINEFLK
jgi:DNA polymerase III alpha subunit